MLIVILMLLLMPIVVVSNSNEKLVMDDGEDGESLNQWSWGFMVSVSMFSNKYCLC